MSIGKAYGFFNCKLEKEHLLEGLLRIKNMLQIPKDLELSLIEGIYNLTNDHELMDIAKEARKKDVCILEAVCVDSTNIDTAENLAYILKKAYREKLLQGLEADIIYYGTGNYKLL